MTSKISKTDRRILEGGESSRSKFFSDVIPVMICVALASHFYGAATAQEIKAQAPAKATSYQSSASASNKPR